MEINNIPKPILDTIMDGSRNAVIKFIRTNCPSMFSSDDINEIISTTRLRILCSISSFDPSKGDFFPWVNSIAKNCTRDAIKDFMKNRPYSCDIEYVGKDGMAVNIADTIGYTDSSYDADRETLTNDFMAYWNMALATLSDTDRRFYDLLKEGLKPREIAAELGCTASAASMRKFHIRAHLRRYAEMLANNAVITGKKPVA